MGFTAKDWAAVLNERRKPLTHKELWGSDIDATQTRCGAIQIRQSEPFPGFPSF